MLLNNKDSLFSSLDNSTFTVEPLPPKKDLRGYLYVVIDTAFPDHIKVGRTTNMHKRLTAYNSDKPYPSTKLLAITKEFEDSVIAEKKVLNYLYDNTQPTTFKLEWFEIEHKDLILMVLGEAEKNFK